MAKKVLLIEDSITDASIVKDILEKEGINVSIATNGSEGIKKAKAENPDLILLDIILPDISGFEVGNKMKQENMLGKTILVFLSIKDNIEDITKAFQCGGDDYVIKPPAPDFLAKKIKLYLGMK